MMYASMNRLNMAVELDQSIAIVANQCELVFASMEDSSSLKMDPLLPYKVLRVPLALGVCAGMVGEVLHECESEVAAQALLYDTWSEDRDTTKGIYYTYEVAEWRE